MQNWAEMLEREFLIIEETLRIVRDGDSEDDESGSEWSGSGSECPEGCECGRTRKGDEDGDEDVEVDVDVEDVRRRWTSTVEVWITKK